MPSTPPPSAPPVAIGEIVAGKYRVERVLGQGGMGVVVAAMHEQLGQRVAIKMLLPEAKANANAVARFMREARAAAAIRGQHVSRVLDVGELEGGAPYIVMEYLEGHDLAETILERGPLGADEAVSYLLQACEAIAEAHSVGIVHRDLKPSNVFVTTGPDGTPLVKVLDFGISKALLAASGEDKLTTTSSFVGSPVYSPPEQLLRAHDVDGRADIWALGTILFEALAARPPFTGDSVMHIASKIFHDPPASLAALRPELHPDLCAVVMKCLSKGPEDRYQDVSELARALAPFAPHSNSADRVARIVAASSRSGSRAAALADTAQAVQIPSGETPHALVRARTPAPAGAQRRWVAIAVGAGALGVVAAVVGLSVGRGSGDALREEARPMGATAAPPPATSLAPEPVELPALEAVTPPAAEAGVGTGASSAPAARVPAGPAPKKNPLNVGVK